MNAVLFGTGWRALFYIRIAKALPELLTIVSVFSKSEDRARLFENGTSDINKALSIKHDAVIVASGKDGFFSIMKMLEERNEFVISETTFQSLSDNELNDLYSMKGAVAEQYRYTPLYGAMLSSLELVGEVDQLYLSGLHNHHAASIARDVLGICVDSIEEIKSVDFPSSIIQTGCRDGLVREGKIEDYLRKIRIIRSGNKLFMNDFSSNQYHSYLYGKTFEIRGSRGIINEREVRIVGDDGFVHIIPFVFHRDWVTGNGSLTLSHATLGGRTVFVNPFYSAPLNDDEIGIAEILRRIEQGEQYPTISSGIEDAKLGKLL